MKLEKILSLIMAAVMPFPLFLAGIASTYEKIPALAILAGISGGIISWFLGQLLGASLKKAKKKSVYIVRAASVILGIIIAVICEIVIFALSLGSLAPIFLPVSYIFWYWSGFRVGSKQALISSFVMGAYGVEAVLMYLICHSFNENASFYIIILTILITVLGALLINSRQLSRLSLRGRSENKLLTKSCLRFNLKATLFFCGILLFAFSFSGIGARWLWEGIKAVIRFFVYLMSIFSVFLSKSEEYDPEEISAFVPVQVNENPWSEILIWIAVIILIIVFFKPLVKLLKNLYRAVIRRLGRETEEEPDLDYTDIYRESDSKPSSKNSFKKALRAFSREKNTEKKFRLGYKAFMIGLNERNLELAPCDTPTAHLQKGRSLTQSESLDISVEKYCRVRYDDLTPTKEDCEVLGEVLREIK